MSLVVIGGHSRSVGKTSVVAGLIAALPEFDWTAMKITQYGHGICSANGKTCHCACDDHSWAITEERDRSGESDSSRFLVSGASRSLWVRTRQGMLEQAMPRIRQELAAAKNAIMESNSIMGFVQPDLYLTVLDTTTADFKASAKNFLERADAVVLHDGAKSANWSDVSLAQVEGKPVFRIAPPPYVTPELAQFVKQQLVLRIARD
jgi:hypothetical protein